MLSKTVIFVAAVAFFMTACADHGSISPVTVGDDSHGAIAFQMMKSETPAEVWVIEARLERDGFATLKKSVPAKTSSDTIAIIMSDIVPGFWKVTVEAKDSSGIVRYSGTASVQILAGQTAQATVQMNPSGGTGNLQILVVWPPSQPQLEIRTAGSFFLMGKPVPVSITNFSKETLILASCCARPDLRLQQKINGTWTPPGQCELLCPSVLLPLKPGQQIVDSALRVTQTGTYRLLLRYWMSNSPISASPVSYSNEFNVVGVRKEPVRLGEEFTLGFGESVMLPDSSTTLVFTDVTEDSRCPIGVMCFWEGNARIMLAVNQSTIALNTTLDPKKAYVGNYTIRLNSLSPYPIVNRRIQKEEYVASLVVASK